MNTNNHSHHIKTLFDGYADQFDSIYGESRNRFQRWIDRRFRESMRLRFERTMKACHPIPGKRVLDVGCGPGQYSVGLAEQGAREVVGLDISHRMIDLSRQRSEQHGTTQQCTFLECDALHYTPQDPFDVTIVMGVMDYIPDPQPFLEHLLSLTHETVCLSFPDDRGFLAWQRRLRYLWFSHCRLNLYSHEKLVTLLDEVTPQHYRIEHIARDYFVTIRV